jgi:hypothetical protein
MNPLLSTLSHTFSNEQLARVYRARQRRALAREVGRVCVSMYNACVYWAVAVAVAVRYFLRMRK